MLIHEEFFAGLGRLAKAYWLSAVAWSPNQVLSRLTMNLP